MPPAARVTDMHVCPMVTGIVPHVGGPIIPPCEPTVLIGMLPAARMTDMLTCVGPPDMIAMGSPTVLIGGLMAARLGDPTDHGGVIILGCPTVEIGEAGAPGPLTVVTPAIAAAIFSALASRSDIAFKYPVDGCYARAHLMVKQMQAMGLNPGKAWTFAGSRTDPLWVNTPNHPDGMVSWGYHVAPTLPVTGKDGVTRPMVMDPSMFDHPVTPKEWQDAQHDHPTLVQTKAGQSPLSSGEGTGYWPGRDPAEGPDANAKETMEEYKRLEGTRGP
jgi:uncharacterized Zn-binding protein involved in type VI secretion